MEETAQEVQVTETQASPQETQQQPAAFERKLSKLAEKEASIRKMKEEAESLSSKWKPLEEIAKNPKQNALKALEHLGLTFEDIADAVLNADTPKDPVQERLEALEKERADEKAASVKKENDAILNQFKEGLFSKAKDYELIQLTNSQELVYETAEAVFAKTGKVLSADELCKMVEDQLEENLSIFAKSSKLKAKLLPAQEIKDEQPQDKWTIPSRTLLQTQQSQVSQPSTPSLTREERRKRAVELLNGIE